MGLGSCAFYSSLELRVHLVHLLSEFSQVNILLNIVSLSDRDCHSHSFQYQFPLCLHPDLTFQFSSGRAEFCLLVPISESVRIG